MKTWLVRRKECVGGNYECKCPVAMSAGCAARMIVGKRRLKPSEYRGGVWKGLAGGFQVVAGFMGQQRSLDFIPIVLAIQIRKKYYPISTLNQNIRHLVFERHC